ncbi:VOC family protein [Mycolicibacterium bacteremicum]|uniref:Glyoxalase n=1 Tax=Mycolicibacterium bacteremicum TaxID=564198 RepID=A0A1W9YY07_MYCBA|nr:glyoxalase [Mycolicibacterium bacteremicum]MCV7430685.1 glyoxalase [Mycolicibacterium bacteremicum]ORA04869.1 glyoxalase [Mycolicibacterium bacteremicum]
MTLTVDEILIADPAAAWATAGFAVDADDVCRIGEVRLRLIGSGPGTGIIGWSLRGFTGTDLDGIPTQASQSAPPTQASQSAPPTPAPEHPNGVVGIDHIVLMSPDLARTVAALHDAGEQPRRERDAELGGRPIRQIFYRLGEVILEVVGTPGASGDGPAELWGLTYNVADIDSTAAFFGDRTGRVKDAVQPGRRITTLRHRDAGMSVRTAFITQPGSAR